MKRSLLLLPILLLLVFISGCLPTYVGDPEKSSIDDHLLGLWRMNGDNEQLWFFHKLDSHQYLIQAYTFDHKDGVTKMNDEPLTCSGWLTSIGGDTYLSMRMFDPKQVIESTSDASKNRYLVARIKLNGDSATAEGVSEDFIKKYSITTPAEFEAALVAHAAEKGTFVDPNAYERVDVNKPGSVQTLLDLIAKKPS